MVGTLLGDFWIAVNSLFPPSLIQSVAQQYASFC